jgi:hypothetical protein
MLILKLILYKLYIIQKMILHVVPLVIARLDLILLNCELDFSFICSIMCFAVVHFVHDLLIILIFIDGHWVFILPFVLNNTYSSFCQ